MADDSWRGLEPWDRVKWARSLRYDSATAAAAALDMQAGTYRCYERGPDSAKSIALEFKHAKLFAKAFKVRWEWLLEGSGEPWLTKGRSDEDAATSANKLRAWREYRNMTPAALAKKANTSAQVIADLESGAAELSSKWLRTLAPALNAPEGYLLSHDPNDISPEIMETFSAIPKDKRAQVLEILKTFKPYHRLK